ncbi:MAG: RAMP superfamily CRISPR-associated protein [Candidatus Caldarchaeum sp.]
MKANTFFQHLAPLSIKLIGDIEFVAESHIHIGDHEPGSSRLGVMRLSEDLFIIPSSTWKGCFRSMAEKLLPSMKLKGLERLAVKAYDAGEYRIVEEDEEFKGYLEDFRMVLHGNSPRVIEHDREWLIRFLNDVGHSEVLEAGSEMIDRNLHSMAVDYLSCFCPLGRLFGNHVVASKLRFHDTILSLDGGKVEVRPGVGIDRSSATAMEDHLFFVEALPVGTRIRSRFVADNLQLGASDSRLLAGVLDWTDKLGVQIGGRKSVGLGLLKPSEANFYIIYLTGENAAKALANPWKHSEKRTLNQLLQWLKGDEKG